MNNPKLPNGRYSALFHWLQ